MALYLRNLKTGEIREVDPQSKQFADLKAERTDDGRFPLYEQTGQHDADPREDYEVRNREQWDAPLHDVTTDGFRQSGEYHLSPGADSEPVARSDAEASSTSTKATAKKS